MQDIGRAARQHTTRGPVGEMHVRRGRVKPRAAQAGAVRVTALEERTRTASGSRLRQLHVILTADCVASQTRELKRLCSVLGEHAAAAAPREGDTPAADGRESGDAECAELARGLVEMLLVPHPYVLHSQLRQCIERLCAASRSASAVVDATLTARLAELASQGSVCAPHADPIYGVLRDSSVPGDGSTPGWLELLFDVPAARNALLASLGALLDLGSSTLGDAHVTLRSLAPPSPGPAAGAPGAAPDAPAMVCVVVQEMCRVLLLCARHFGEEIRAEASDGHAGDGAIEACVRAIDSAARGDEGLGDGGDRLGTFCRSLVRLCHAGARLLLAPSLPTEPSISCAHLAVAVLEQLSCSPRVAAEAMQRLLHLAQPRGDGAVVAALRGVAQGATLRTLCARGDAPANADARAHLEPPLTSSRLRAAAAASAVNGAGQEWPECLLFGAIGGGVTGMCADCLQPTVKLFAFRALETLVARAEALVEARREDVGGEGAWGERLLPALCALVDVSLQLVWDNWEISFQSLVGMFPHLFKRLLALRAAVEREAGAESAPAATRPPTPGWLLQLLPPLRALDWTRKAKYHSVHALLPLLPRGAALLLELWPTLLPEVYASLHAPNMKSYACQLLDDVLRSLRCEWPGDGGGYRSEWTSAVIAPLVSSLLHASATQSSAILQSTLPPLLAAQPAALGWILDLTAATISAAPRAAVCAEGGAGVVTLDGMGVAQCARLVVALLRTARSHGLLSAEALDEADRRMASDTWPVRRSLLASALLSDDEALTLDALDLVAVSQKLTEPPTPLQLDLLAAFYPLRLKGASAHLRRSIIDLSRKWLHRLRACTFPNSQLRSDLALLDAAAAAAEVAGGAGAAARQQPPVNAAPSRRGKSTDTERMALAAARRALASNVSRWLRSFGETLLGSIYPGAAYDRALLALELYAVLVEVWELRAPTNSRGDGRSGRGGGEIGTPPSANSSGAHADSSEDPHLSLAYPYGFDTCAARPVEWLLGMLRHDFDAVRVAAYTVLAYFPRGALQGLETPAAVGALVHSALPLLQSARAQESESAALILRVVVNRYVLALGWRVLFDPDAERGLAVTVTAPRRSDTAAGDGVDDAGAAAAVGALLDSLRRMLASRLASRALEPDAASEDSALHGPLVMVRLVLRDIEPLAASPMWRAELSGWLSQLLDACAAVCDAALGIIARPATGDLEPPSDAARPDPMSFPSLVLHKPARGVPDAGCGSIADWGFLGADDADDADAPARYVSQGRLLVVLCWLAIKEAALLVGQVARLAVSPLGALLPAADLDAAGRSLMRTLLTTRHNGAIEKGSVGLGQLVESLLAHRDPEYAALPAVWLKCLLDEACDAGTQPDTDATTYLRRSAGLPFAMLAVLYGEHNLRRGDAMLATAVQRLLDRADADADPSRAAHCAGSTSEADGADDGIGPWLGRVHAFNLLRHIVKDKAFGISALPFIGRGFMAAIGALSAPRWPVRNAATLLLSALLERSMRHRRSRDEHDGANALGVRDFFARAPGLDDFLLRQLSGHEQPDLFAILLLLSKLVPSPVAQAARPDALDLGRFVPLVERCAALPPMRLRVVASRALVPLVSPAQLPAFAAALARRLPAPPSAGSGAAFGSSMTSNDVHGVLLQLRALLGAALERSRGASVMHAAAEMNELCAALLPELRSGWWLLSTEAHACAPVRSCALQLLQLMLCATGALGGAAALARARRDHGEALDAALGALAASSERALRCAPPCDLPASRGARAELLGLHARVVASAAAEVDDVGADERGMCGPAAALLSRLLCDAQYEARLAALLVARHLCGLPPTDVDDGVTALPQPLPLSPPPQTAAERLSAPERRRVGATLVQMVESEQQRSCALHAAALLVDDLELFASLSAEEVDRAWRAAHARLGASRDVDIRSSALALAAQCSARASPQGRGAAAQSAEWLERLSVAGGYEQPQPLRLGAAKALGASGLLTPIHAGAPDAGRTEQRDKVAVGAWLVALRVLDDDDALVRAQMASLLSPLVAPGAPLVASAESIGHALAAPRPVEPNLPELDEPSSSRRPAVFEKEADNSYAEPLDAAQRCAPLLRAAIRQMQQQSDLERHSEALNAAATWRRELEQWDRSEAAGRHKLRLVDAVGVRARDRAADYEFRHRLRLAAWALARADDCAYPYDDDNGQSVDPEGLLNRCCPTHCAAVFASSAAGPGSR